MRYLYTLGFYIALPFILARVLWRARKNPHTYKKFGERLGFYDFDPEPSSIWLHAVSYGEAVAAEPLIRKLKENFPKQRIVITTMTLTGGMRVQSVWKNDNQIRHLYVPYDIPFAIKRFLNHNNPLIGIIMETELWPNLLFLAGKQKLPLVLANARLSPRSFSGYLKIKKLISPLLKNLTLVAAQSEQDAERFLSLGVPAKQTSVLGNLKFDITPPSKQIKEGEERKKELPFDHILVAASTHANEEEQLLDIFSRIQQKFPRSLLILVPRHPERFDEVANLCQRKGQKIVRRSANEFPQEDTTVFIGDSMGELYFFYSMADIAFVGGSLVPVGGHNLLEPAALRLPIVTGPHLFNFTAISELLLKTETLHAVKDGEMLYQTLCHLLQNREYSRKIGMAGYKIFEKNQGATDRHLFVVEKLLPRI